MTQQPQKFRPFLLMTALGLAVVLSLPLALAATNCNGVACATATAGAFGSPGSWGYYAQGSHSATTGWQGSLTYTNSGPDACLITVTVCTTGVTDLNTYSIPICHRAVATTSLIATSVSASESVHC